MAARIPQIGSILPIAERSTGSVTYTQEGRTLYEFEWKSLQFLPPEENNINIEV